MSEKTPFSVVLRYIQFVNEGDLEGIASMTSSDLKFTDYAGDVFQEEDFMQKYMVNFPEYQIHVHHALQGGDGIAIIGKTSGSHVEPEVEEREILLWTAEVINGLIAEWRIYKGEA
ncbi:MAG: nuclear transport factor 2 family protein [Candidatus Promineifilaceae bacterium]